MTDPNKDLEIIDAIKTGKNGIVLDHLYKTALPNIVRFIMRNNGDKEEAKDIFQDAVVTLYSTVKLGKYDSTKQINGFLYFVARNLWINRVKKKSKQVAIVDTESYFSTETAFVYMVEEEKRKAVEGLMEKIGSPCKELFKYVLYDKLSMKEVAQKMGYSGETVAKATHYQCKRKLAVYIFENKHLLSLLK